MKQQHNLVSGPSLSGMSFSDYDQAFIYHEFSSEYQAKKQALINEIAQCSNSQRTKGASKAAPRFTLRAAAAVAAICVALPTAAWAVANHMDFFAGAFGTGWRQSQSAVQSFQAYDGEKPPTPVVYPASDVVQLDAEAANALIGSAVCDEPLSITVPDGHELTITSAVRSEHALVYSFTLYRDGGVTCLDWNERTNNVAAKGAYVSDNAQFTWNVYGDEYIYIDPDSSTPDTLVGYSYSVFGEAIPEGQPVKMNVITCDVSLREAFAEDQYHEQEYEIPCTKVIAGSMFKSAAGSALSLSPLGLNMETRSLFAAPSEPDEYDMAQDPVHVRSIAVHLDNGETYTVFDNVAKVDNTLSYCAFGDSTSLAFNRLVDPSHVASIDLMVTDAQDMSYIDENEIPFADWPVRTVTYTRS